MSYATPFDLPLFLRIAFFALSFFLAACGSESVKEIELPEKDTASFRIPGEIQKIAPLMQEHLYRLLPYQSSRFQVKPDFVFIEGPVTGRDDLMPGRLNPLVMHMNLIHLVYYRGGELVWSGSILKGLRTGAGITSKAGYLIKLANKEETVALFFQDGETIFEGSFPIDLDRVTWLENGANKLFLYHYVLPVRSVKSPVRDGDQEAPRPEQ